MSDETVVIEPIAVKRSTAARLMDCGETTVWQLCRDGKLDTVKVRSESRVTVASIRRYIARGGDA